MSYRDEDDDYRDDDDYYRDKDDYYEPRDRKQPPKSQQEYYAEYKEKKVEKPAPGTPPKPKGKPFGEKTLISPKAGGLIAVIGVIMFFLGIIIMQAIVFLDSDDYDDDDEDKYYDRVRALYGWGRIFNWIGAMIIAVPMYYIGMSNDDLDWKLRASMLTTASAIVITTIIVSTFFSSNIYYW